MIQNGIHDNGGDGLQLVAGGSSVVNFNNLYANGGAYELWNGTSSAVDARYNWWGHYTGPYHPTLNPDGLGDPVSDDVLGALLDWEDDDDHQGPRGAESGYYAGGPSPYRPKNKPIEMASELLLMRGVSPAAF